MMGAWKHAAEMLIAHFHAICHGVKPLHIDWDKEARDAAYLDSQSISFLYDLKALAGSRGLDPFLAF